MSRRLTSEERKVILDHPELVMFNPYSAIKTHHISIGRALILPFVVSMLIILCRLVFPAFINDHTTLFAVCSCIALIVSCGFQPVLYKILDDRFFRKAEETFYAECLQKLLPEDVTLELVHIQYVVNEKAEGGWIRDGREEGFGFSGYVNCFAIRPETDLAVIHGGKFFAYIKRDSKTERFYT